MTSRQCQGAHGAHSFPWRVALRSPSVVALLVTAFCYVYAYTFFQTWFHTFLVKGSWIQRREPAALDATVHCGGVREPRRRSGQRRPGPTAGIKVGTENALGVAGLGCAGVFTHRGHDRAAADADGCFTWPSSMERSRSSNPGSSACAWTLDTSTRARWSV
jgi:hypothetical protein